MLLTLVGIVFFSTSINATSSASPANFQPYVFAEFGYGMGADSTSSATTQQIQTVFNVVFLNQAEQKNTTTQQWAAGVGMQLPSFIAQSWFASNQLELMVGQLQNKMNGEIEEGTASPSSLMLTQQYSYVATTQFVLVNYTFNFKTPIDKLEPFFSVGAGYSHVTTQGYSDAVRAFSFINSMQTGSNSGLAYQAGLGVNYAVATHWHTSIGYRYLALAPIKGVAANVGDAATPIVLDPTVIKNNSNQLYVRLNYQF